MSRLLRKSTSLSAWYDTAVSASHPLGAKKPPRQAPRCAAAPSSALPAAEIYICSYQCVLAIGAHCPVERRPPGSLG